jgi:tetratricopeptide (TPR) repeat protein
LVFSLIQHNSIELAAKLLSEEYKLYSLYSISKFNELTSLQWKAIEVSLLSYSSLSSKSLDSLWALAAFYAAQSEHSNLRKTLDTIFLEHKSSVEYSAEWFNYSGDCWRWHSDGKQLLKSLSDYNRAIELDSTKSWLLVSIGHIKVELFDYEGALETFIHASQAGINIIKSLDDTIRNKKVTAIVLKNDKKTQAYKEIQIYTHLLQQINLKN